MAEKLLIQPLNLADYPTNPDTTNPGFGDLVTSELGDLATPADGFEGAVNELGGLVTALELEEDAQDAELDAILALLDTQDPSPIGGALDAFGNVQPTGQGFLDGIDAMSAPTLAPLSLVQPDGAAAVVFGGAPSQGGAVKAGSPAYILHLDLGAVNPATHNIDANGGDGPNPPFAGFNDVALESFPDGKQHWVYHITINPTTPGTFLGQAKTLWNVTVSGISGTIARTTNFQVVVQ